MGQYKDNVYGEKQREQKTVYFIGGNDDPGRILKKLIAEDLNIEGEMQPA
jgi:hypothetical protein